MSGTLKVQLENGEEVEVDAAAYMAELKAEAQRLRAELSSAKAEEESSQGALATSLSAYVSKLPEDQLKALTSGITDDVVSAMRMLVAYILRRPGPEGQASSDEDVLSKEDAVTIEGDKMTQLCLYQLVLGYKLREAEATGEAQLRVGL